MSKIVFINRYFYPDHSATSQLLGDLAFELSAVGYQVEVVTSRMQYDDANVLLAAAETVNDVLVRRVWTTRFGRGWLLGRTLDYLTFYLSVALLLVIKLRRQDLVVVKTDPPMISVVAALVAGIRGAVLVNWVQDLFPEVASKLNVPGIMILSKLIRPLRNYSLHAASNNVVIGELMAHRLQAENVDVDKITVIHNWSDGSKMYPLGRKNNTLRKDWNLNDMFVVGYSGNLGRAHEFETLMHAAYQLQNMEDVVFLFIGGGAQFEQLKAKVTESGIGNFIFKPYQPRESLVYSLGVPDVHLVTLQPELEGFIVPSKFYGIAAVGRPAIYIGASDGEIPRILKDSHCGFTVSIGDVQGLSKYITDLYNDSSLLKEMGHNARAVFEANFDKRKAISAWKKVINDSISRGGKS